MFERGTRMCFRPIKEVSWKREWVKNEFLCVSYMTTLQQLFSGIARERRNCPLLFCWLTMTEVPTVEIPDPTQDAVEVPASQPDCAEAAAEAPPPEGAYGDGRAYGRRQGDLSTLYLVCAEGWSHLHPQVSRRPALDVQELSRCERTARLSWHWAFLVPHWRWCGGLLPRFSGGAHEQCGQEAVLLAGQRRAEEEHDALVIPGWPGRWVWWVPSSRLLGAERIQCCQDRRIGRQANPSHSGRLNGKMVEIKENDCLLFGKNLQEACSLFLAQRQPLVCVHHKAGADSPWGFVQNLPAKQR